MVTEPSRWTFALVDLVGFTALTETHGDDHAAELAVGLLDIARASLADGDLVVKAIGDAVLVASPTAAGGIELVRRVLRGCAEEHLFLATRTGVHEGPAVRRGDDFFGAAVNVTARIADRAQPGHVLVTTDVAAAAERLGYACRVLPALVLKNLARPVVTFEVDLGVGPVLDEVIDPVCRMRVVRARAAAHLVHDGTEHWFCSAGCAQRFREDRADAAP